MRRAIVCLALGACGGDIEVDKPIADAAAPARRAPNLPVVDDAGLVVAPLSIPQPAAFVWVGTDGKLELAPTGAKWTGEPPAGRAPAVLDAIRHAVLQSAAAASGPMHDDARNALAALDIPDPQLARQQAIDQARSAGILGSLDVDRMQTVALVPLRDTPTTTPLVLASPKTPARAVAQVLIRTGGFMAVVRDGKPGILASGFGLGAGLGTGFGTFGSRWIEVHPEPAGVTVLVIPDARRDTVPWKAGAVDRIALRDALAKSPALDIDVLIGDDTTAQQLVDLIGVAQATSARRIGVGERMGTVTARTRTAAAGAPKVSIGLPNTQGDLDKAIIRRYIKRNIMKIQYCYEKQLLVHPGLDGTLNVQFYIGPDGNVASSTASGIDADVATCVADVIKGIQFPKPKGGGGVQVNYPFRFRPTP